MLRTLQARADDLLECLLISELEMRRSRTLERRMDAFRDFGRVVDRIDVLRRDAEALHAKEDLLASLDRKVASILRSSAYRISEWFATDASLLAWFIHPQTDFELRPC